MKLDALDHPKTHALTAALNISRPTAIGHLELLWAFTGKNAPQGNIGKWPNGSIARACDWAGDPDQFVSALVASRLLDLDDEHRVSVHDWHEHAPGWVRAKLKGLGQQFLMPKQGSPPDTTQGSTPGSPHGTRPSIQGKCSEGQCSEGKCSSRARVGEGSAQPAPPKGDEPTDTFALLTRLQAIYPAGTYTGVTWHQAERELGKLLDAGESAETIVANTTAYREQQQAAGKIGTQFIRSPKSFFGEGHWRGPFPLPSAGAASNGRKSVTDTLAELRAAAGE